MRPCYSAVWQKNKLMSSLTPRSKGIAPKFKEYAENPRWKDFKFYRVDICEQQVRPLMSSHQVTTLMPACTQDVGMTSGVKMAPTFHFYKDGAKLKEYVGSSYPALEVRLDSHRLSSSLTPLVRSARWAPSSPATDPPPSPFSRKSNASFRIASTKQPRIPASSLRLSSSSLGCEPSAGLSVAQCGGWNRKSRSVFVFFWQTELLADEHQRLKALSPRG